MPDITPKRIEVADLAESVTIALQRALETKTSPDNPIKHARIICGIIIEPPVRQLPQEIPIPSGRRNQPLP